jgi:hypothetical protein
LEGLDLKLVFQAWLVLALVLLLPVFAPVYWLALQKGSS